MSMSVTSRTKTSTSTTHDCFLLRLPHHSLTLGNLKQDASTSRRPFFERVRTTHPARSTISHPQLRDLLICPEQAHHVQTISGNGVDAHVFGQYTMRLMDVPTSFSPNCLVHGCGMVAMGGENKDLLIRSTDVSSRWEIKLQSGHSIVNSACFYQVSSQSNPQLLVCNNDHTITQYDISHTSAIQSAAQSSLSADPSHRLPTPSILRPSRTPNRSSSSTHSINPSPSDHDDPNLQVSEKPVLTLKGSISLSVPINHCSLSPDSRSMIAVGDSNEVFLYDCSSNLSSNASNITDWRSRARKLTLPGVPAGTGSFSTSWNQSADKFAIASEAEVVVVYDVRMVGRPILVKKTTQKGRAGAARVVKFTPEGPNELLAFTEHRSLVHVIDARTFDSDHDETLMVPTPLPGLSPFPPRLPPGSIRADPSSNNTVISNHNVNRTQQSGRSRLNERLNGSTSILMGEDDHVAPEEDDEVEEEEEEWQESRGSNTRDRGIGGGEISERRTEDMLWGELAEVEGEPRPTPTHEPRIATTYQLRLRRSAENSTTTGEGSSLGSSSGGSSVGRIGGNSLRMNLGRRVMDDDDEVCIEPDYHNPSNVTSTRRLNDNSRPTMPTGSSSSSSSNTASIVRRIQIHGSSLRPMTNNFQTDWLEFDGTNNVFGSNQGFPNSVRSGMWDDLIGLCWSPDGNWLCSGTEAGIVEWKVKRSARTGFGDARLC